MRNGNMKNTLKPLLRMLGKGLGRNVHVGKPYLEAEGHIERYVLSVDEGIIGTYSIGTGYRGILAFASYHGYHPKADEEVELIYWRDKDNRLVRGDKHPEYRFPLCHKNMPRKKSAEQPAEQKAAP